MSGIQKTRELISNHLMNRCKYVDQLGHYLQTGDVCLIHNIDNPAVRQHIPKNHLIAPKYIIGVFIKITSRQESKFVIACPGKKPIVRTLHDKNYKKYTYEFQKEVVLDVIAGDYSKMNEEWKKSLGYYEAIKASKQFLMHF